MIVVLYVVKYKTNICFLVCYVLNIQSRKWMVIFPLDRNLRLVLSTQDDVSVSNVIIQSQITEYFIFAYFCNVIIVHTLYKL